MQSGKLYFFGGRDSAADITNVSASTFEQCGCFINGRKARATDESMYFVLVVAG